MPRGGCRSCRDRDKTADWIEDRTRTRTWVVMIGFSEILSFPHWFVGAVRSLDRFGDLAKDTGWI